MADVDVAALVAAETSPIARSRSRWVSRAARGSLDWMCVISVLRCAAAGGAPIVPTVVER